MTRKNSRYTKRDGCLDPFKNLAADVIIDAIIMAGGNPPTTEKEQQDAIDWLQGEQCQRWAGVIGVDIRAALDHRDSQVRIDNNADR